MRAFILPLIFAGSLLPALAGDHREEFREARKIEKSNPDGCVAGMTRCFRMAAEAGDHEYTIVGGLNACGILYRQNKKLEAGNLAREVIITLESIQPTSDLDVTMRRIQLFNFIESALLAEGKIGAALQSNRASAETIRGNKVRPDADGRPLALADIFKMEPIESGYGMGVIERHTRLLEMVGKSNEARQLLDDVAIWLGDNWQDRLSGTPKFYASKLLATRAQLLDFLGYKEEAIREQEKLLVAMNSGDGEEGKINYTQSRLTLRINLLRNRSQWSGPTEEIMKEAREVAAVLRREPLDNNVDRQLANMEFDFKQSREPLDMLEENARKNRGLGDEFDATFADRDNLFARAKLGDPGLDPEFFALLKTVRSRGHKNSEPSLYREYGGYLVNQERAADAIPMFIEALRLTRTFGLDLHVPPLLGHLIGARLATGDSAGTRAALDELDEWIRTHRDAPAARRADAEVIRASTLFGLGDAAAARTAFNRAKEIGKDLPDYQKKDFNPEAERLLLAKVSSPPASGEPTVATAKPLRVQPVELVSVAPPGQEGRTRFAVFNPTGSSLRGNFIITGPGAEVDATGKSARFDAGKIASTVKVARTLKAGEESTLIVSMASARSRQDSGVNVAWQNDGQAAGPESTWQVTWSESAKGSILLDAASIEANPFRSIALYHELSVPLGEATGIPFRLRSPVPLRFEYLDSNTGEIIAVDANGNGDFTEAGDIYIATTNGASSAVYPVIPGKNVLTAEIRIFAPDGLPLLTAGGTRVLEAEVFRGGSWVKEAEDTLR